MIIAARRMRFSPVFVDKMKDSPSRYAVAGHTAAFTIVFIAKFAAARSVGRCRRRRRCVRIIWRRVVRCVRMIVMMRRRGRQIERIQVWICVPGFRVKSYFSFLYSLRRFGIHNAFNNQTTKKDTEKKIKRKREKEKIGIDLHFYAGECDGILHGRRMANACKHVNCCSG